MARNNAVFLSRERNGRITRSGSSGSKDNELKDIVAKSAASLRNISHESGNTGGKAFLSGAVTSGGITITGSDEGSTASSSDLANNTNRKLRKIGNKLNNVQNDEKQREKDQLALIIQLIATLVVSVAMMAIGSKILLKLKNGNSYSKLVYWLVAGAMIAVVAGLNAWLMATAIKFMQKYQSGGGTNFAKIAIILAPIMVGGMTYVAIKPESWKKFMQNIKNGIKKGFDLTAMATNQIMGMFGK